MVFYRCEFWVQKLLISKSIVEKIRMMRWMCKKTNKDKLRDDYIRGKFWAISIQNKVNEKRLGWFGHR